VRGTVDVRRKRKEQVVGKEPRGRKKIKVEKLERPEQELTPEEAEEARGGLMDGSVRFVTEGSVATLRQVTDGTSNP
jgi:hypothetical protein